MRRYTATVRRARAFFIGLCLVALGCHVTPLAAGGAESAAGATTGSAGCGVQNARVGNLTLSTRDGDGTTRSYRMLVPADYRSSRTYPLFFVFHASAGNPAQAIGWGLQKADGAAGNGIFIFPEGIKFEKFGVGWDSRLTGRDLPFFDNMLKDVEAGWCVDHGNVFATGFSWGADFVIALACTRGDAFRAVAANSGTDEFRDTSNYQTYEDYPCQSTHHPAARFEHAQGGDKAYPPPDFATTSRLFQYMNACGTTSTPLKSTVATKSCVAFNGCAVDYVECAFDHAMGHALPPKWSQDTWDYFQQESLKAR